MFNRLHKQSGASVPAIVVDEIEVVKGSDGTFLLHFGNATPTGAATLRFTAQVSVTTLDVFVNAARFLTTEQPRASAPAAADPGGQAGASPAVAPATGAGDQGAAAVSGAGSEDKSTAERKAEAAAKSSRVPRQIDGSR